MLKMILHVANWVGYLISCDVVGTATGKLLGKLFGGFLEDEQYAEAHPTKWIFGFMGILFLGLATTLTIVWWPLNKLREWIDSKIDSKFESEEEAEKVTGGDN